jgi:hypothetical protein
MCVGGQLRNRPGYRKRTEIYIVNVHGGGLDPFQVGRQTTVSGSFASAEGCGEAHMTARKPIVCLMAVD